MIRAGRIAAVLVALVIGVGAAGCRPGEPTVTVLAAASLTEPFDRIAAEFGRTHPGVRVRVSYGSSAALAEQAAGAPADVFAAADQATMDTLATRAAEQQHRIEPVRFASNTLQIAVPPKNPGRVSGLADFADPARRIALCDQRAPCGAAAQRLLARAGITARPDTYEVDAKATLTKVRQGEVDAALVYRTDVVAAGSSVRGIPTPGAERLANPYLITTLPQSGQPALAAEFTEYVARGPGRAVLTEHGFGPA